MIGPEPDLVIWHAPPTCAVIGGLPALLGHPGDGVEETEFDDGSTDTSS